MGCHPSNEAWQPVPSPCLVLGNGCGVRSPSHGLQVSAPRRASPAWCLVPGPWSLVRGGAHQGRSEVYRQLGRDQGHVLSPSQNPPPAGSPPPHSPTPTSRSQIQNVPALTTERQAPGGAWGGQTEPDSLGKKQGKSQSLECVLRALPGAPRGQRERGPRLPAVLSPRNLPLQLPQRCPVSSFK